MARMKVLLLGNSQDTGDWFEGGPKRDEIVQERLAAEFGVPVEIVVKNFWPNERLPGLVERWVRETNPDMVYVNVTVYPFAYESLPLRARRLLGRFGPAVGDAGLRLAGSKRWAHNAAFRTARRCGLATIGGDTHFTCDEVIDRTQQAVRAVLRYEGPFAVVEGPLGRGQPELTRRERRRREARRQVVHQALRQFCGSLHVYYIGSDTELSPERRHIPGTTVGDGIHLKAEGHAHLAEALYENIRGAWLAHDGVPAPAPAGTAGLVPCS